MQENGNVADSADIRPECRVQKVVRALPRMKTSGRFRDIELRIRLLEYVARTYADIDYFAAMEARYASKERRADVLVVSSHTHAYEIKSDVDRLDRLTEQLKDYRQTFDFLTIVTTQIHAHNVKRMLGGNDGLIVISCDEVIEAKRPKMNRKITKKNMISLCSKTTLAEALGVANGSVNLEEIRSLAERKLPLSDLRNAAVQELRRRFEDKYYAFLENACIPYRESDLTLLRQNGRLLTNLLLT